MTAYEMMIRMVSFGWDFAVNSDGLFYQNMGLGVSGSINNLSDETGVRKQLLDAVLDSVPGIED